MKSSLFKNSGYLLSALFAVFSITASDAFGFAFRVKGDGKPEPMEIGNQKDAFLRCTPDVKEVTDEFVPTRNLLMTWEKFGVRVLQTVRFNAEETPELFRRRCGFAPFMEGANGIWLDHDGPLPEPWKNALEAAKVDAAIMERLFELASKAIATGKYDLVSEGRMAKSFVVEAGVKTFDPDSLRVEAVSFVRHLEKLLGEAPKTYDLKLHLEFLDTPPIGVPFKDPLPQSVPLKASSFVNVAPGVFFRWSSDSCDLVMHNPQAPISFRIYVPSRERKGEWNRYDFSWKASKAEKLVDQSCLNNMAIQIEPRFKKQPGVCVFKDSQYTKIPNPGTITFRPTRCFSKDYLNPDFSWTMVNIEEIKGLTVPSGLKGPAVHFSLGANSFFGNWPASVQGVSDVWFVDISAPSMENGRITRRLLFPKGAQVFHDKAIISTKYFHLTEVWGDAIGSANWLWERSWNLRFRTMPDSGIDHSFGVKSDRMFAERILAPSKEEFTLLAEKTAETRGSNAPIRKMEDSVASKLLVKAIGMFTFKDDMVKAHRDFLLLRMEGKEPEARQMKKKSAEALATLPDADIGGGISLDEEF